MIISFVKLDPCDEEFFATQLAGHEVRSVRTLDAVEEDVEIVSVFIDTDVTRDFLEAHPQLRLIVTRSHSHDHIDLPACKERGIAVCTAPPYGETTVAEHTFALILALSRRLREVMSLPKGGRFSYEATRGFDLAGKTLGIIGLGRIGRRVAQLGRAFGMEVLFCDPQPRRDGISTDQFTAVSLHELLERAHVISLHANLTPETLHILNRETIARCRRGVLIVNTARGALVDTNALSEALESGQVGGAGLDVLQDERVLRDTAAHIISAEIVNHLRSDALASEAHDADRMRQMQELVLGDALLARTNVVFTPHVAFNSDEAAARLREATLENISAFLGGTPINVL